MPTPASLFATIEPFASHRLAVGDGHTLHVEEAGSPDGLPVVFLHGGPGSGCSPLHRRYFDPDVYRVVLVDQRGAGRSEPLGSRVANTTSHLLADLERVRQHLAIERWLVFGGSWGATLGLLYAQRFPARVTGLVLRGTFLARRRDLQWVVAPGGVRRLFPEAWSAFEAALPGDPSADVVERAGAAIAGQDADTARAVALGWEHYTGQIATLSLPEAEVAAPRDDTPPAVDRRAAAAGIELHYASHGFFIRENQILDGMAAIAELPAIIVHGRRDLVCPVDSAFALHARFRGATLEVVRDAGHLGSEPAIADALVRAAATMSGARDRW